MKLAPKFFFPVLSALNALDGLGKGESFKPFKFSAKTNWNKTKNIRIFQEAVEDLESNRRKMVTKYSGSPTKDVPLERVVEFSDEWEAFIKIEIEVPGVLMLTGKELGVFDEEKNPKGNMIVSSVLAALTPILALDEEPSV